MNRREAYKLREAIVQGCASLPDNIASEVPDLFNNWEPNKNYVLNDRVKYNTTLYKCIQAHTSQSDWTPDAAVSLWARTDDPREEWPEWVQPVGASDAYAINSQVSHNGSHWISDVDNNVWEPGVYGWHNITE